MVIYTIIYYLKNSAHVRTGSTGSLSSAQHANQTPLMAPASSSQEELRCLLEHQHQGHQQPITCMEVVGSTVLTGSQDHTLKVSIVKYVLANRRDSIIVSLSNLGI